MDLQENVFERTNDSCWFKEICKRDNSCNACAKYKEFAYLMESSNLPKAKQRQIVLQTPKVDLAAYERLADIKQDMYDFVSSGKSLYIGSLTVGNAKTSWAIKLMHRYFEEVWENNGFTPRALFVHVPSFLMQFKNFKTIDEDFEELKKLLFNIDLVIWDDITGMDLSAYDYSVLLSYIDYRSLAELSNIYTGNAVTREELGNMVGVKIASRILARTTEVILFEGLDYR